MPSKGQILKPGNKSYVSGCTRGRLGCRIPGAKLPASPGMMGDGPDSGNDGHQSHQENNRSFVGRAEAERYLLGPSTEPGGNCLMEPPRAEKKEQKEGIVTQKMVRRDWAAM